MADDADSKSVGRKPVWVQVPLPALLIAFHNKYAIIIYNYVLNDPTACSSLMAILTALYDGRHVYVCIADYINADYVSILNESFMKLIQTRYDIKYSIINNAEDINYIPQDGCDFMSVMGIQNFDNDRKRYLTLSVENQIMTNTLPMNDDY